MEYSQRNNLIYLLTSHFQYIAYPTLDFSLWLSFIMSH
jgi:hypothetical protein